jgi:hypothetical protein
MALSINNLKKLENIYILHHIIGAVEGKLRIRTAK